MREGSPEALRSSPLTFMFRDSLGSSSLIWPHDFGVNCARPNAIILQLKYM